MKIVTGVLLTRKILNLSLGFLACCLLLFAGKARAVAQTLANNGGAVVMGGATTVGPFQLASLIDSRDQQSAWLPIPGMAESYDWFQFGKRIGGAKGHVPDLLGVAFIYGGDPLSARRLLDEDTELSNWGCFYRGLALWDQANSDGAIQAWQACPEFAELFFERGNHFAQGSDQKLAIKNLRLALEIDPGMTPAYYLLGDLYREQGDFENALDIYRLVRHRDPDNINNPEDEWNLLAIGHLFREKGEGCTEAEYWYSLAQLKFPSSSNPYIYQGVCNPNLDGKLVLFQKAGKVDPTNYLADYWLGSTYLLMGNRALALASLEMANQKMPAGQPDLNVLITLGDIYRDQGQFALALSYYQRILQVDPDNVRARTETQLLQSLSPDSEIK